jgi:ferrochelatase
MDAGSYKLQMKKSVGVVLFQLGGPDSPDAVEPFLFNLFCDPDIINFPLAWIARRPLARYISRRRAAVVREHYDAIGGRSPIRLLTERQARGLEKALAAEFDVQCWVAMRYWHPLTGETAAAVRKTRLDELVLLPLYPQYSFATTASSLKEWKRLYHRAPGAPAEKIIEEFHTHPLYIDALVKRIATSLTHFEDAHKAHILFSAHGLPMSLIEKGDPYQRQVNETVESVMSRGGWANGHTLCYQSRVGRKKWLEPALIPTIKRLAQAGEKHLLVIPISFVTEHIETLHEINIEAREEATSAGIERFEMMAAVGESPLFIETLASLVRSAVLAEPVAQTREKSLRNG